MVHFIKRYTYFFIIGILIIIVLVFINRKADVDDALELAVHDELEASAVVDDTNQEASDEQTDMMVDIKGAVQQPGVYHFTEEARMIDIIEEAGGFSKKADEQQINLAQRLHDEMYIYIPEVGEEGVDSPDVQSSGAIDDAGDKVKVNQATIDDLVTLNGVGPSKAQAILDYIDEHGPFEKAEDILQVSGIGEKTLDTFKDDIIIP